MPLDPLLVPVRQRDIQMHDKVSVARRVGVATRAIVSLDHAREPHGRELALDLALWQARPHRGALRRVLADCERVQQLEPAGIGEGRERLRGALI